MKKIISTNDAPQAIGPYSQGIEIGNLVFTSGQIPIDPATGKLVTDSVAKATKQSLENISAILAKAGLGLNNVIKTTVFLKNLDDFSAMNEVYANFFSSEAPARSCVQVAKLPMDAIIEIEAIAHK